jgi:hypothetical protein
MTLPSTCAGCERLLECVEKATRAEESFPCPLAGGRMFVLQFPTSPVKAKAAPAEATVRQCTNCERLAECLPLAALAGRDGRKYLCPKTTGDTGRTIPEATVIYRMGQLVTEIRQTLQHTHGDPVGERMAEAAESALKRLAVRLGINWEKVG